MYNLGEYFKINLENAKANPKCIIKGDKYRFTVLTERLIRLEYNDKGEFIDEPTQLVIRRNLPIPKFEVIDNSNFISITTSYFKLTYIKGKSFIGGKASPANNLKVEYIETTGIKFTGNQYVNAKGQRIICPISFEDTNTTINFFP